MPQNSPLRHGSIDDRPGMLLTGATGMVGSMVLAHALRAGRRCGVLVRGTPRQDAEQRIDQLLDRFESAWSVTLERPEVITADLNQPDLGLDAATLQRQSGRWSQIIHSAASLSFAPAAQSRDNEPYRTNVQGTETVVKLAARWGVGDFHHVSTAYVCGRREGRVGENEIDVGQEFANDYERSKAMTEDALHVAQRKGVIDRLTIYRPSIVIDRSGLAPVSGDRTIYGAFAMYQMLAARFGLPERGEWFRNLGFAGHERKNIIDVDWIARAILTVTRHWEHHGRTYHLTTGSGTSVNQLDEAFHVATLAWLSRRGRATRTGENVANGNATTDHQHEIDRIAQPFVETFLPYFRDDPQFDRANIDRVIATTDLEPTPAVGVDELLEKVSHWTAPTIAWPKLSTIKSPTTPTVTSPDGPPFPDGSPSADESGEDDEVVIAGYEVRLPGGVDNVAAMESMLFDGRSVIGRMPDDRLDRGLYWDARRGVPGMTYTEMGGCVAEHPLDRDVQARIDAIGSFDLTHTQFAQVAVAALRSAIGVPDLASFADSADGFGDGSGDGVLNAQRCGIFVGHSGGTAMGGPLAMATMASTSAHLIRQTEAAGQLDPDSIDAIGRQVVAAVTADRPRGQPDGGPHFNAYSAASLAARLMGFRGRREVIDAACSSSLLAMHHAVTAIRAGNLDVSVVGGATFNNVDNLALFSQSGACSDDDCYPFDVRASGLISSEGYVAVVLMTRGQARRCGAAVLGVVEGVGVSSDGKGKGLWAPRSEGQQLAMRRARDAARALDVDYLECHATSTQVGDATELESIAALIGASQTTRHNEQVVAPDIEQAGAPEMSLAIGSIKSNLGHLLEAAGLVGLVKCLIAMRRQQLPPSIHFQQPTPRFDWQSSPVRVVDRTEPWPRTDPRRPPVAAVNAFGIGGLNAHAVIRGPRGGTPREASRFTPAGLDTDSADDSIAIVGRGVVLPGAASVDAFAELLRGDETRIADPPDGRWLRTHASPIGVGGPGDVPHCRGGYIDGFQFDAQSYRIPPKMVAHANPAQLMIIEATRQAMHEFDGGAGSLDPARIGVVVGTIFGGEFSNSLQIGLRLPELASHLRSAVLSRGLPAEFADEMAEQFRRVTLARFGALLDETGGFTASTLASRITRTFDWMGGACAVDADEASGGLALLTAVEQLRAGHVDAVLCGVTQRSMDLVAFEQLYRRNQLVTSGNIEDLPKDGSRIFPGEGVAIILLQRHRDAVAQGRRVLGRIDDIGERFVENVADQRSGQSETSWPVVSKIGHLGGAHGIVRLIAQTTQPSIKTTTIAETAQDGYQVHYRLHPALKSSMPAATARRSADPISIRLQANDRSSMAACLDRLAAGESPATQHREVVVDRFHGGIGYQAASNFQAAPNFQAALVGRNQTEIAAAARAMIDGPLAKDHTSAVAKHAAWLKTPAVGSRVAWLFPGQGSQYAAEPSCLHTGEDGRVIDPAADAFLRHFDERMVGRGLPPIRDRLADPDATLGRDIWWTQLWVLAVGSMLTDALRRRGHRPDVMLGHSFGECTAAWCGGVMTLDQAIGFAKCRSDAVVMSNPPAGAMLSVRGEPSAIAAAMRQSGIDATISHHNSTFQTVLAGDVDAITRAKTELQRRSMASVVIAVPAAFHTPAMRPAQDHLRTAFAGQRLRPPQFAFLSAISNRYLAEPDDIRESLVTQLTRPVCFAESLRRLVDNDCGLMIEVGPGDVLTRLAGETVNGQALCLAADVRGGDAAIRRELIDTACEAFGQDSVTDPSQTSRFGSHPHVADAATHRPSGQPETPPVSASPRRFTVVDVTHRKAKPRTMPEPIENGNLANGHLTDGHRANGTMDQGPSPTTTAPTISTAGAVTRTSPSMSRASARLFLFDLVVDLTGYDPDIIDFSADLEAELGIDSIKKAQLIGELIQWGDLSVDVSSLQLSSLQSLDDILNLSGIDCGDGSGDPAPVAVSTQSTQSTQSARPTVATSRLLTMSGPKIATVAPSIAASGPVAERDVTAGSLESLMVDLVVDQTGYDRSIIDMDADLEGELGVDSIKKAQLLGELEQQYQLNALRDPQWSLADFATLRSIHDFIWNRIQPGEKKNAPLKTSPPPPFSELCPATGTHRFALSVRPSPRVSGAPTHPTIHGPAIVLGDNEVAAEIARRWRSETAFPIHVIGGDVDSLSIDGTLDAIWADGLTPHLFLTTPHDAAALWRSTDSRDWVRRRDAALMVPYRVCQRWMTAMIDADVMQAGSLVTLVRGGGDFGFGDHLADAAHGETGSAESGGLAGLTKAMLIEAWMRGHRDTPMLVIDRPGRTSTRDFIDGVWREWAVPSHDEETAVSGEHRWATHAEYRPLNNSSTNPITRGGHWIVAGGGRGITAMTAMELAATHGLTLHLLGTAPTPEIDDATRSAAAADRLALRRHVMATAQSRGDNPVEIWRDLEKAIEIDQTLTACRDRSIAAFYHGVDVSDASAVADCLARIRRAGGVIRGVIQGAGAGQDARFDRKRPDKVAKCLRAKIDGAIALADATQDDPLEWFVGFGSISGRFGANGHTDYSAANDMLAKIIGRLRVQRPGTRCVTFHWHAWGDIGMATKPEAKLALDMIGMEFMPAAEGLGHFMDEIHHGGDEAEVLITDRRYVRKFIPSADAGLGRWADRHGIDVCPMLREADWEKQRDAPEDACSVTLDPTVDVFLKEHVVQGRPTLPLVIAIEMLAEAARRGSGQRVTRLRNVIAHQAIKCLSDEPFAVELIRDEPDDRTGEATGQAWSLVSDLRRRDGRLVQSRRRHFSATIDFDGDAVDELSDVAVMPAGSTQFVDAPRRIVRYPGVDAPVHHGVSLRCLREIGFSPDSKTAVGIIVAPSPVQLGGERRPTIRWAIPPAVADAVLYAAGMLAFEVAGRPSLPVRIDRWEIGRWPTPGEPCRVVVRWVDDESPHMTAVLTGINGDMILCLTGYQIGWIN